MLPPQGDEYLLWPRCNNRLCQLFCLTLIKLTGSPIWGVEGGGPPSLHECIKTHVNFACLGRSFKMMTIAWQVYKATKGGWQLGFSQNRLVNGFEPVLHLHKTVENAQHYICEIVHLLIVIWTANPCTFKEALWMSLKETVYQMHKTQMTWYLIKTKLHSNPF